ncbi:hypothetical protein T4A_13528, partial [Trichinella pseudospiralis]
LKFNPAELICVSQWSSKCAARKTPKRDNACLYVHQDLNEDDLRITISVHL